MIVLFFLLFTLSLPISSAVADADLRAPEAASTISERTAVYGEEAMVVAGHPLASEAGLSMLKAGGSAIDAAIAAQMVLNLVEPQSSGIGGGGFLLYHDAHLDHTFSIDGREAAPANTTSDMFLHEDGTPRPFKDAVKGGQSVGVPGILALLHHVHAQHGTLPWQELFQPAIALAENGYAMTERMENNIDWADHVQDFPESAALFFTPDGQAHTAGTILTNTEFAETLRLIATEGIDIFYNGEIGKDLAEAVQSSPFNPGALTIEDLRHYHIKERAVLCIPYQRYRVCSMGPPSSGGLTVMQALGILRHFPLSDYAPDSPTALHLITEALRLAFADRNAYIADPDFVDVPVAQLLHPHYLRWRAGRIRLSQAMKQVAPGLHSSMLREPLLPKQQEPPSTTHISVIDANGNAVSLTSSIEYAYGSGLSVRGFLLNNQLTDFSFRPEKDGKPVANRLEPGKRPRSSMSPTLVFGPDGNIIMIVGSPGGARIISYTLHTILNVLDWEMDMQEAISYPRIAYAGKTLELEADSSLASRQRALEALGHEVTLRQLVSGVHGIHVIDGQFVGGADPRREGVALGH